MVNPNGEPFLKSERKKTDDSLGAERSKSSQSIEKTQIQTERRMDTTILSDRLVIDQNLSTTRANADVALDLRRSDQPTDAQDERATGDRRLRDERSRSDQAVEQERARSDNATSHDRVIKTEKAERLLTEERLLTDKSLQAERNNTDAKVHESASSLTTEIADHLITKVSLTTRDEFIAIVSHDLRNPIGAAASSLEMLLEESASKAIDKDTRHWIEFAKRNVDTSLRLISNLLDIERIAQGKLELELKSNDLEVITAEALESFALVPAAKLVTIRSIPSSSPAVVICDHDRILQVICNLMSNALKFTPDGGDITVEARSTADDVVVSISDTGPGIPLEKRSHIFERFAQIKSKDRSGLGLGLHISKMFVEAHKGKIWVESKVGLGSSFHFMLPKDAASE